MSPAKLRLFVAVDVPGEIRAELQESTTGLKRTLTETRWVPIANQHITLKFLGPVEGDRVEEVMGSIRTVAAEASPAQVSLAGLGAFPNERRARVLWAGVSDPDELLTGLAGSLDRALAPLGFATESRPYHPHLTLARFKQPAGIGPLEASISSAPFTIGEVVLYASKLAPTGATYSIVGEARLG